MLVTLLLPQRQDQYIRAFSCNRIKLSVSHILRHFCHTAFRWTGMSSLSLFTTVPSEINWLHKMPCILKKSSKIKSLSSRPANALCIAQEIQVSSHTCILEEVWIVICCTDKLVTDLSTVMALFLWQHSSHNVLVRQWIFRS